MNLLKPTANKMIVTPYRRERTRGGGIMLTEKFRNVLMGDDYWFWVVAVGPKVQHCAVKDRVLLAKDHESLEYLTDGTLRAFVTEDEVLAVSPHEGFEPSPSPAVPPQAGR